MGTSPNYPCFNDHGHGTQFGTIVQRAFSPSHSEQWFLKLLDLDKKLLLLSLIQLIRSCSCQFWVSFNLFIATRMKAPPPASYSNGINEHIANEISGTQIRWQKSFRPCRVKLTTKVNWISLFAVYHILFCNLQNFKGCGTRNVVCNVFSKTVFHTLKLNLNNDLSCLYENWNGIVLEMCVYSSRRFQGDTIGKMFEDSVNVLYGRSEMLT